MATTLTNKIIKVIVDSKGVKSGVDDIERQLDRARSAVASTSREIDRELKKIDSNVNTGTSGTLFGALTGRKNLNTVPRRGDGRDPLAVAIGRNDFENYKSELSQATERAAALNRIYKVYEDAIARAAGEVRNSAAAERALKAKREELARRISAAADAQNLSLSSRLRAAGGTGADSLGSGFRLSGAFNRDPGDAEDLLGKIRSTISPSSGAAAKLEREQNALGAAINDRQAEERRLRAIARSLGIKEDLTGKSLDELRQAIDGQANSMRSANSARQRIEASLNAQKQQELNARNRVISGLAAQRAAALSDPDNLAALNRFERNRGLPATAGDSFGVRTRRSIGDFAASSRLSRGITGLADRGLGFLGLGGNENSPALAAQLLGGAAQVATKAVGIVGGALAKVGTFVFTEFVNFVSRVAANLTSRLIAAGVEGLAALSLKAIDAAKKYEDAITSFGVLAGGQTRGTQLVDQLQKLAIDTPFKFAEVLDQSKLLLSYGVSVNDLTKRLRQLGDVASGTGVDLGRLSLAFGQVLAKGRLQGPEIRQFTEAGVGIRDFVAAFNELEGRNVSTQGFLSLVEAGDVSAKVVERAFDKMTSAGGRFFNFMEVRSKTVSGRLSALGESFELVLQKVGKSIFDKFNVAGVIDDLVKKLGGIDFKAADARIGRFADAAVPFGRGVFGGFAEVFSALQKGVANLFPDQKGVKDNFNFFGKVLIPGLIEITFNLASLFLKLTSVVANFTDILVRALEVLYPFTFRPLVGALEFFGRGNKGGDRPLLKIRDFANDADVELKQLDLANKFRVGFAANNLSLEEAKKIVAEEDRKRAIGIPQVAPDNDLVKKAKELVKTENEKLAKIKKENDAIAQGLNDRIQAAFNRDRFVAARDNPFRIAFDKADGFAPLGITPREVKGEDVAKFNAILQGDIRGLAEQVTGGAGVAKLFESATGIAIPKNLEEFNKNLKEAAFKGIPNFNQRLEEISKLGEKTKDPVAEFKRNLDTINRADTDLARRGGFGLEPDAARRARGQLARQFIEQFKTPEIQPAPLVRAASQEAEQALTRAIYDARNNGKTPEAELQGAIEQAEQTTKELNTNIDRLATATEAIVPKLNNGGGNFFAIGFGL